MGRGVRSEQRRRAAELRAQGRAWIEIAEALRARWPDVSPRAAARIAHGWSQKDATLRWNDRWPEKPKDAKHFSGWETWPHGGRRPSLQVLEHLAQLYQISVSYLVTDIGDHRPAIGRTEVRHQAATRYGHTGVPVASFEASLPSAVGSFTAMAERVSSEERRVVQADETDVEIVRAVTAWLANSENAFGGQVVARAGLGQLAWGTELLEAGSANPQIKQQLLEAVGNLAGVVGFAAFDAGENAAAAPCFRFALSCADDGDCWSLRACTLADIARVHAEVDDVDAALSAIEFAKVRMDRLSYTAQAMLCVMHGRYLALTGRHQDALRQLDTADNWFDHADPSDDPPWLCYYDQAEHDGSVARALMPIALATGQPQLCRARLESAVQRQQDGYPRSRVFSHIRLAGLVAGSGDPDDAAEIGAAALTDAKPLRSQRVADELAGLLHTLNQRSGVPALHRLHHEVREHLTELQTAGQGTNP